MGWLDRIFRRKPRNTKYAFTTNGYAPIFSQYGTNIYASDVVQQALKCIVDEMKKTIPTHIREKNGDPVPISDSSIQRVLNEPNQLMTTSEFIEKSVWMLLLNYNVFIVPTYYTWEDKETKQKRRYYEALYPLNPTNVDFIEDASGRIYVTFRFLGGEETTIPYDDVIHVKKNYSVNEYMGGNEFGQPDNRALLDTLELNETMLRGIARAMNSSYQVNGVVKYNTMLDGDKMEANLRELERKLNNSESGFLPMDMKAEFMPFARNIQLVDDSTLKFVDEKILRNWHIPLSILTGDYTKEQYEAFYQATLEPLIIAFSQAFTKKLFTAGERSYGNQIKFYPKDLIFMTISQKLELVDLLSPTGSIFENEKRAMFGLRPLEELEGKRYMSLNWVEADLAAQYQLGKVSLDIVDENKTEIEE